MHVISLHAPLTSETLHILDRDAFAKCRDGVILVNTARGPLIDTEALVQALNSGRVAAAGLDVVEEESVMRKEADQIIADQIIDRLKNYSLSTDGAQANDPELSILYFREASSINSSSSPRGIPLLS
jgi:lactate dehydrogenase-like 2-hydroxyacid dehydrogenase